MSTKIIPHIFGSLLSLEKSLAFAMEKKIELPSSDLPKIVGEMKKLAQLIQIQFARNDLENAMRSLNMFYGLLSMIRPLVAEAIINNSSKTVKRKPKVSNLH